MYGKIFESMYDGSLYGQWEALITMQQLIVIADEQGVVDMTPPAISGKTSIPLDIIKKGIDILSKPDPYSRTPDHDGIRIMLLDDHRPWGWYIVNYKKYRDMVRREDKLEADRERIATQRKANKINDVADCSIVSHSVADVAHTDTDTDTDTEKDRRAARLPPKDFKPTEKMRQWAVGKGYLLADIDAQTESFMRWERPKPVKNWKMAWERWMLKGLEFRKENVAETTPATTEDWAMSLGLGQGDTESDEAFKARVCHAMVSRDYT